MAGKAPRRGRDGLNLPVNDRKVFIEALTNPRPANDRLRDTVRRYRQATGV
ncbi:DUF1778 domain-containing protein [Mesorhizobium sp. M2A.F.Ca.ET.037.01.1.1]|nr:DUF1778 domain-containing protein [Mesorhizobium sp. M2A.F.Ca.ET.046.03.2.1]RUX11494.1 DUF1778 domain-containing protein [Mesorhizobium sp. M2A.F.Ca.ET.037.01.1.1]RUX69872.1 DUF1778 domain-containing protein [Mesorhizobium sp. M2A.F.Ca.ET.040.01.1.1]RVC58913.1 DUF1778 domain-containing protein [Mesorhizobium sp. M00.F.Ca.ET.038.03.1.1]RVC68131.1 DUF1778 domain-containing protein [Mesorhizobium sp. M2A.F.Ca.ET.046.02.1.1]RWA80398.1 MAG: DUF1778 domain-containing protein [Mesorhizobium sp.]R